MNSLRCFFVSLVVLTSCGCSGSGSYEDFIPTSSQARSALEAALTAWKSGKPCEAISDRKPVVQPYEARWQAGAKLTSFEILKEIEDADKTAPKKFLVKEELAGSKGPEESTYYILGIDPLEVYREADYLRASGMGAAP